MENSELLSTAVWGLALERPGGARRIADDGDAFGVMPTKQAGCPAKASSPVSRRSRLARIVVLEPTRFDPAPEHTSSILRIPKAWAIGHGAGRAPRNPAQRAARRSGDEASGLERSSSVEMRSRPARLAW